MISFLIFIILDAVAIFLHGFYFGRKNNSGIIATISFLLVVLLVEIYFDGLNSFEYHIFKAGFADYLFATILIMFWWILGFIASRFYLVKKEEIGIVQFKRNIKG